MEDAMALSGAEVDGRLAKMEDWRRHGEAIRREFRLGSFREAMAFLVRVGFEAEERNHHPEIANVYNRVTITLTTHDDGGVTELDFELAGAIDAIASGWVTQ